ncbi:MAG: hypothetical protein ACPGVT_07735 [Maricaulaceae bacterium]
MDKHKAHYYDVYEPAGRLVPIFAASDNLNHNTLALNLAKSAAAKGETVLLLDVQNGDVMEHAGIIYNKTLGDVIHRGADISDVLYITSNEHFTAAACGDADIDSVLGSMAALSLSYDWVFVSMKTGCTPAHIRLASAADVGLLTYDTAQDYFMRAYWMIETIRARAPQFDPLILSNGAREDAVDSALMLTDTVRNFLGAPPSYAGHITDENLHERLLGQLSSTAEKHAVA